MKLLELIFAIRAYRRAMKTVKAIPVINDFWIEGVDY